MAVAHDAHTSSATSTSVASFNWTHTPTGTPRAAVVFVCSISSTAEDTAVTYGSSAMTVVFSGADTDTEPGTVQAWFADNVPSGNQTVTVTRTNDATQVRANAVTVTAASACEVYSAGVVTRGGSATNTGASTSSTGTAASGESSVDDGSPGTNSQRYQMFYTGAATPLAAGTNSTSLLTNDFTAFGMTLVRETNVGQGARSVGVATGTTDDTAAVALAVREIPAQVAESGWSMGGGTW